jgi:hypothetical protein
MLASSVSTETQPGLKTGSAEAALEAPLTTYRNLAQ